MLERELVPPNADSIELELDEFAAQRGILTWRVVLTPGGFGEVAQDMAIVDG